MPRNDSRQRVCRACCWWMWALGLVAVGGCGSGSDRLEVSGAITLDGAPLDSGSIRFTSLGETLVASGAIIQDGQYRVPAEQGLLPGKYLVEIRSPDNDAPPVVYRSSPGERGIPTAPERIPPEFNVDSQQQVEVTAAGDNRFAFDIVSRQAGE